MISKQLILSNNKTNFVTEFKPSIELNKPCEISLINLETYYSIPNINHNDNLIVIVYGEEGDNEFYFYIPPGSYSLIDINIALQKEFKKLYLEAPNIYKFYNEKNDSYPVTIKPDFNRLKTILIIDNGYYVNFAKSQVINNKKVSQINKILGFKNILYKGGTHESENIVNILPINSILINLDIVSGSYVKGVKANTIYSFFPNVNPGHKIIERPPFPIYLPLLLEEIHSIRAVLTDQDGNQIDLRGENITMRFHIREIEQH